MRQRHGVYQQGNVLLESRIWRKAGVYPTRKAHAKWGCGKPQRQVQKRMLKLLLVSNNARGEGRSHAVAVPVQQCETEQLTKLFTPGCLCEQGSLNYGNLIQVVVLTWGKNHFTSRVSGKDKDQ